MCTHGAQSKAALVALDLHNGLVLGHHKVSRSFSNLAFPPSLPTPSSETLAHGPLTEEVNRLRSRCLALGDSSLGGDMLLLPDGSNETF